MNTFFDLMVAAPANTWRGLAWLVEHPPAGIAVALGAVAVGLSFHLHLGAWRRKGH